jgi:hypothetical protein
MKINEAWNRNSGLSSLGAVTLIINGQILPCLEGKLRAIMVQTRKTRRSSNVQPIWRLLKKPSSTNTRSSSRLAKKHIEPNTADSSLSSCALVKPEIWTERALFCKA